MDANKKVDVNEAFIAEWLKHECMWDVDVRAYKDLNARENALRDLAKLFEIIWNNSTQARLHPNSSSFSFSFCVFPF